MVQGKFKDWGELVESVKQRQGKFPLIEVLWRAHAASLELNPQSKALVCEQFAVDHEEVAELAAFVRDASSKEPGTPFRICIGVSCRARGSRELHDFLLESLDEGREIERLECMDHCDAGPTLGIGNRIYCGTFEDITIEERTWRHGQGA